MMMMMMMVMVMMMMMMIFCSGRKLHDKENLKEMGDVQSG